MFTVFLHFLQIGVALIWEPRELVWKSVTAILHRHFVSEFKIFFQANQHLEPGFQIFQISDPLKCVLGPADVFACFLFPMFYRFVYNIENVPQTLSDAPQKLIVYTFPSIWQ